MENKLQKIREEKGWTQEKLAEESGVSRVTISGIESGKVQVVKTDTLAKIADALGMTIPAVFFCS